MNVSQLLARSNQLRRDLTQKLLREEPKLVSSFHFNDFFKNAETATRDIFRALKQEDNQGRELAEKLAEVLDIDRARQNISRDHLYYSLYEYGTNPNMDSLKLDESHAQEALGSLFETLDTLIQSRDDMDSHLGESESQVSLNQDRLEDLVENFETMIGMVLEKVSGDTFDTLERMFTVNMANLFYAETNSTFTRMESERDPVKQKKRRVLKELSLVR